MSLLGKLIMTLFRERGRETSLEISVCLAAIPKGFRDGEQGRGRGMTHYRSGNRLLHTPHVILIHTPNSPLGVGVMIPAS